MITSISAAVTAFTIVILGTKWGKNYVEPSPPIKTHPENLPLSKIGFSLVVIVLAAFAIYNWLIL